MVEAAADRIKVAGDIMSYAEFFQADVSFPYDRKAFDKRLRADGAAVRLRRFRTKLADVYPFDVSTLDVMIHEFADTESITIGQIIHVVRVAVTGKAVGFGLFDTLAILGREACLARIDRALGLVEEYDQL